MQKRAFGIQETRNQIKRKVKTQVLMKRNENRANCTCKRINLVPSTSEKIKTKRWAHPLRACTLLDYHQWVESGVMMVRSFVFVIHRKRRVLPESWFVCESKWPNVLVAPKCDRFVEDDSRAFERVPCPSSARNNQDWPRQIKTDVLTSKREMHSKECLRRRL